MSRWPTLDELRGRVHKDRHTEIGNWLARRVARPSAVYGTWLAVRLGMSANQVTALAMLSSVGCAMAIGSGTRWGFVFGVALAHLAFWLDHVDGQVARWNGTASLDGVYLDYLMHHAANMLLGFSLGHGLAVATSDPRWSIAGFLIALGWAGLSLHNDCRFKAFHQRLKRSTTRYRVEPGSGGRPAPPAPWPRHGTGMVTWPAYKACEIHVVLMGLACLAVVAIFSPGLAFSAWRWGVLVMAVLAPALALARIVRSARNGATEREFSRWFELEEVEAASSPIAEYSESSLEVRSDMETLSRPVMLQRLPLVLRTAGSVGSAVRTVFVGEEGPRSGPYSDHPRPTREAP
jgi:hypothetical protein